jgi:hypothetical protein
MKVNKNELIYYYRYLHYTVLESWWLKWRLYGLQSEK